MLRNWFANPRWKTYASQSGYVYQYIFDGVRDEHEYIFRATSGPEPHRTLEVILPVDALRSWERALTETECYGIAKMALMRALDRDDPPSRVEPTPDDVAEICRELDL